MAWSGSKHSNLVNPTYELVYKNLKITPNSVTCLEKNYINAIDGGVLMGFFNMPKVTNGWRAGVSHYFWGFYVRTIVRYLLIWPTTDTRGNPFDTGFVTA